MVLLGACLTGQNYTPSREKEVWIEHTLNCLIVEKNIGGFVAALAVVGIKLVVLLKEICCFLLPSLVQLVPCEKRCWMFLYIFDNWRLIWSTVGLCPSHRWLLSCVPSDPLQSAISEDAAAVPNQTLPSVPNPLNFCCLCSVPYLHPTT